MKKPPIDEFILGAHSLRMVREDGLVVVTVSSVGDLLLDTGDDLPTLAVDRDRVLGFERQCRQDGHEISVTILFGETIERAQSRRLMLGHTTDPIAADTWIDRVNRFYLKRGTTRIPCRQRFVGSSGTPSLDSIVRSGQLDVLNGQYWRIHERSPNDAISSPRRWQREVGIRSASLLSEVVGRQIEPHIEDLTPDSLAYITDRLTSHSPYVSRALSLELIFEEPTKRGDLFVHELVRVEQLAILSWGPQAPGKLMSRLTSGRAAAQLAVIDRELREVIAELLNELPGLVCLSLDRNVSDFALTEALIAIEGSNRCRIPVGTTNDLATRLTQFQANGVLVADVGIARYVANAIDAQYQQKMPLVQVNAFYPQPIPAGIACPSDDPVWVDLVESVLNDCLIDPSLAESFEESRRDVEENLGGQWTAEFAKAA